MSIPNTEALKRTGDSAQARVESVTPMSPESIRDAKKAAITWETQDAMARMSADTARAKIKNDPDLICSLTGKTREEYDEMDEDGQNVLCRMACQKCNVMILDARIKWESPTMAMVKVTSSPEAAKEQLKEEKRREEEDRRGSTEKIAEIRKTERTLYGAPKPGNMMESVGGRQVGEKKSDERTAAEKKATEMWQIGAGPGLHTWMAESGISKHFNASGQNGAWNEKIADSNGKKGATEGRHGEKWHRGNQDRVDRVLSEISQKPGATNEEKAMANKIADKVTVDEDGKLRLKESVKIGEWLTLTPQPNGKGCTLEWLWFRYEFAEMDLWTVYERASNILFLDKTGITVMGSDVIRQMFQTVNEFNQSLQTNAGLYLDLEKPGGLTYADKLTILILMDQLGMNERKYDPGDLGKKLNEKTDFAIRLSKTEFYKDRIFNRMAFEESVRQLARKNMGTTKPMQEQERATA